MSIPADKISGFGAKQGYSRIEGIKEGGSGAKNSFLFNSAGSGPGIWSGIGVTKTKPSSTIFVTNIPQGATLPQVEALFANRAGFIAFRSVRKLAFVDFDTVAQATDAMRTFQGFVMPGFEDSQAGLLIDYDKDPAQKRETEFHKQMKRIERRENSLMTPIYCRLCGVDIVRIMFEGTNSQWSALPRDRSCTTIDLHAFKCVLKLNKGDVKAVKRVKTNTIEKQYRLNCYKCDLFVAFSLSSFNEISEIHTLYMVDGASSLTSSSLIQEAHENSLADETPVVLHHKPAHVIASLSTSSAASASSDQPQSISSSSASASLLPPSQSTTTLSSLSTSDVPSSLANDAISASTSSPSTSSSSAIKVEMNYSLQLKPKGVITPSTLFTSF